jgi:hypothetical protein
MVKPNFAETVIKQFVQSNGPLSVRNLKNRSGFPKSVINSILHTNRHYLKIEQSPLSSRNKKVIWKWSDVKVPLPQKIRVLSPPKVETLYEDKDKDAAPSA